MNYVHVSTRRTLAFRRMHICCNDMHYAEKIQFVTQLPSKVPSSFLIRAKPTDVPVLLIKITLLAPQDLQVALLKDSDFLACKQTLVSRCY